MVESIVNRVVAMVLFGTNSDLIRMSLVYLAEFPIATIDEAQIMKG